LCFQPVLLETSTTNYFLSLHRTWAAQRSPRQPKTAQGVPKAARVTPKVPMGAQGPAKRTKVPMGAHGPAPKVPMGAQGPARVTPKGLPGSREGLKELPRSGLEVSFLKFFEPRGLQWP
jgi:hypothetical protein